MTYDQIKKVIESCHLNFLIGSGASRPYLDTLGTIEKLLTDLANVIIDQDKKTVIDASIKKHYFEIAIRGNLFFENNTEKNFIDTSRNYRDFITSINTILSKRKSNLISKQANLFTTNMDLFLERTLEDNQIAFNDGFSGRLNPLFGTENFHNSIRKTSTHYEYQSEVPLFNLFKLHGSLNWRLQNENVIAYDYNLSVLNKINKIKLNNQNFLDIDCEVDSGDGEKYRKIYTIEELIKQYDIGKYEKLVIHDKFLNDYNKLVMINPTKEKFETTTRNLSFYELLRMYSNHLEKENSVLFIFGFSFADEHIKEITKRVSAANPTLLIIIFAFDNKSLSEIQNVLPPRNNIIYISDENDERKYSLDNINISYFKKLANELLNPN